MLGAAVAVPVRGAGAGTPVWGATTPDPLWSMAPAVCPAAVSPAAPTAWPVAAVGETFPEVIGITAPPDTASEREPAPDGTGESEVGPALGADARSGTTEPSDNVEDPVT